MLEVSNLSKSYRSRRGVTAAAVDVSLRVCPAQVLAFLGSNGAGKTTVLKSIVGLIQPDEGRVSINGCDAFRDMRSRRFFGAVLEGNRNLYWRLTPTENLEYFGVLKGMSLRLARARSKELLERFGLLDKERDPVHKLSRGMQQKLAIAVAIVHDPPLVLLDEPTLGLDVEASIALKELIRDLARDGRAVVLTTHQLDVAEEVSDRVTIIHRGRIELESPTRDLLVSRRQEAYTMETVHPIAASTTTELGRRGATVDGNIVTYVGENDDLWRVVELLKPYRLERMERALARLSDVFLDIVREKSRV